MGVIRYIFIKIYGGNGVQPILLRFCLFLFTVMPRTYRRITTKGDWSSEALAAAMEAVDGGRLSKREASRTFGIPLTTLCARLKNNDTSEARMGCEAVLTPEFEDELARQIIHMSQLFYGATADQVK